MSGTTILMVNCLFAAGASLHNLRVAWIWRRTFASFLYLATAIFAAVYSAGFVHILASGGSSEWQSIARTLSMFVWPIVWVAPSLAASRTRIAETKILQEANRAASTHLFNRRKNGLDL